MSGVLAAIIGSLGKWFRSFTWSYQALGASQVFLGGIYANLSNAKYFAFGASNTGTTTTSYRYSTDGSSWSAGTLPLARQWGAAATNGTTVAVFTTLQTSGAGTVAYTTNGTTWTSATLPYTGTAYSVYSCIWDGTRWLAVTNNSSTQGLIHSTDLSSWTEFDVGNGGYAIAYDGSSRYVIMSAAFTATHRTCTSDPTVSTNWSNITLPATAQWTSVVYGSGTWVAFRPGSSSYATSTNGTTWTSRTLPTLFSESTSLDLWAKSVFAFNRFYLYAPEAVYASEDGITWTLQTDSFPTSGSTDVINGWAIGPDKMLGFGYNSPTSGSSDAIKGV